MRQSLPTCPCTQSLVPIEAAGPLSRASFHPGISLTRDAGIPVSPHTGSTLSWSFPTRGMSRPVLPHPAPRMAAPVTRALLMTTCVGHVPCRAGDSTFSGKTPVLTVICVHRCAIRAHTCDHAFLIVLGAGHWRSRYQTVGKGLSRCPPGRGRELCGVSL